MSDIEQIINFTKKNKCDLYSHLMTLMNLFNSFKIKSVFTNNAEQGHIANFIKYIDGNITLNCENEEFKKFGDYENCKFLNKNPENIKIQDYELMQFDCSQEFSDWEVYINRLIRLNPLIVVLCNTKKNTENSKVILKALTSKPYNIDTIFDDYYGMIILKYRSI